MPITQAFQARQNSLDTLSLTNLLTDKTCSQSVEQNIRLCDFSATQQKYNKKAIRGERIRPWPHFTLTRPV